MERQLQYNIAELRDKEIASIELQRLCSKMEKQLVQQVLTYLIMSSLIYLCAVVKGCHFSLSPSHYDK